jgi:hypothetical protein
VSGIELVVLPARQLGNKKPMNLELVIASEARQSMNSNGMDCHVAAFLAMTVCCTPAIKPSDSKFNSYCKGIT